MSTRFSSVDKSVYLAQARSPCLANAGVHFSLLQSHGRLNNAAQDTLIVEF